MPTIGERLAGRYRIDGQLGTGGMATVYRGHDLRLARDVAVKMLLPQLAGDRIIAERFDREARSLAAVSHPNVVAVFDVEPGEAAVGVEPFFVMELCEGGSLADRIAAAGGRLAPDELVPIVDGVADGLAAVHGAGLVHRDVKPHNVLIGGGRAKLGDLGLARPEETITQTELTTAGTALGTLAYLAPERLAGVPATAASDVWSLGALVFQGLTGVLPRPMRTVAELADRRLDPPPLVSAIAPDLGTAFDEPLAAALDPEPGRRPAPLAFSTGLVGALGRWSRDGGAARWAGPPPVAPRWNAFDAFVAGGLPAAIAEANPTGAVMASDSASTASLAVPVVRPAAPSRDAPERTRANPRLRSRSIGWIAVVAVLAIALGGLVALAGILGTRTPGSGAPSSASGSAGSAAVASSPSISSASASASASTSASVKPTADRYAPANARLSDLRDAVAAASGGHGLKGHEANELEGLIAQEQQALDSRDGAGARKIADQLVQRVNQDVQDLDGDQASALVDAAQALRNAVANL